MTQGLEKETVLKQAFLRVLEQTSDGDLRKLRQDAFDYFSEVGFPTVADEEWKYTNVAEVAKQDFKVAKVQNDENESSKLRDFNYRRNGLTAMHTALADVVTIIIPRETKVDEPITLALSAADGELHCPHYIVIAEAGSKATIVESYESDAASFTNSATQIFVDENANLTHYRVQKESTEAFHVGTTEVTLKRGSHYDSTNINLGAKLSRHDVHLKFTEEGAEAFVDGLYVLSGDQHHDTHSEIDHAVPNCLSHQTYKGVLNDKSRGVFNGKVFVRENASGTDAQQSNKNLLLSNEARVDTKPQLEIYNDDVKCSHGATVGQLEDEELFYLLSRGLNEQLARNLLTYGFAEEIVNKIGIESIKKDLDEAVLHRLNTVLED